MSILITTLIVLVSSIIYFSLFYLLSLKFKKVWLADMAWATGFFVVYEITLLINKSDNFKQNLILLMLFFWGLRLGVYLFVRNSKRGEDFRYQKLKEKWGDKFKIKSYFFVFLTQALALTVVCIAPIIASSYVGRPFQIGFIDFVASAIWLIGFLLESIGDLQMFEFKSNPDNHGKIFTQGLWKYTRHPNYFGESLMWIAIAIMVLNFPYGILALISPIFITFFLLKVTGINTVEPKLKENPAYYEYIKNTSAFIPWFPKNTQQ